MITLTPITKCGFHWNSQQAKQYLYEIFKFFIKDQIRNLPITQTQVQSEEKQTELSALCNGAQLRSLVKGFLYMGSGFLTHNQPVSLLPSLVKRNSGFPFDCSISSTLQQQHPSTCQSALSMNMSSLLYTHSGLLQQSHLPF